MVWALCHSKEWRTLRFRLCFKGWVCQWISSKWLDALAKEKLFWRQLDARSVPPQKCCGGHFLSSSHKSKLLFVGIIIEKTDIYLAEVEMQNICVRQGVSNTPAPWVACFKTSPSVPGDLVEAISTTIQPILLQWAGGANFCKAKLLGGKTPFHFNCSNRGEKISHKQTKKCKRSVSFEWNNSKTAKKNAPCTYYSSLCLCKNIRAK